jgi:hypothetical protein
VIMLETWLLLLLLLLAVAIIGQCQVISTAQVERDFRRRSGFSGW